MEIKNHNTLSYYNFKDIISKHIHTQMGKSNIHEIPVGKSNLFLIKKKKKSLESTSEVLEGFWKIILLR